jgi:hypothetical protein
MEYATLRWANGNLVPRTEAHQSFRKFQAALAAAGGHAPCCPDGEPLLWNERQGWHARERTESRRVSRPLSEFIRRQLFREYQIRQEQVDREIAQDRAIERELVRSATPLAWRWARTFRHGFIPRPHVDSPAEVLIGWRLHRRGMYDPSASL